MAGYSLDPIEQVVASLDFPDRSILKDVVRRSQEEFRALNLRHRLGTLGKADRVHARAAALVEYVAREKHSVKLSNAQLAKAGMTNEKRFILLHRQLGRFRNDPIVPKQPHAKGSVARKTPKEISSTIPSLAIKLGSRLSDPGGVARRAQLLFKAVHEHARTNPDLLHDISRHLPVYEAACFFLAANGDAVNESPRPLTANTENTTITLEHEDIADASTAFTLSLFKEILPHTRELVEKLSRKTALARRGSKKQRRGTAVTVPGTIVAEPAAKSNNTPSILESITAGTHESFTGEGSPRSTGRNDPRFADWADRVLKLECEMQVQQGTPKSRALTLRVDQIIQDVGLEY